MISELIYILCMCVHSAQRELFVQSRSPVVERDLVLRQDTCGRKTQRENSENAELKPALMAPVVTITTGPGSNVDAI